MENIQWVLMISNSHLCALLSPATDGREEAEQTVVENLRGRHQGEAHAEPQQAPGVGDVGRLGDLLILHEPFSIGILKHNAELNKHSFDLRT